jgi:HAD superfamily phosphoserine phosphatase-like hydrolase
MMACVLVDVDGTLLGGPSSELRFIGYLAVRRRIGWAQLCASAAFTLRWFSRYGRHVFKKNKAYLCGLTVDEVAADGATFVDAVVRPRLRGEILDLIAGHVARGDRVVLLTGTPEFIAEPLGRLLGAHSVCATRCARQDDVYTAEPPLLHPFGDAKVILAREICRAANSPLAEAVAYADSIHDLPLMLQVGRAVAAWPDAALRAIAEKGNWSILPQKTLAAPAAAKQETRG